MKAVKIPSPKQPLEVEESSIPEVRGKAVLVKVLSSGVCHTDLHLWEGGYHGAPGVFIKYQDRGVVYPMTPGHEVAGVVEQVGSGVTKVKPGERVLVYPWIGDGDCRICRMGEENHCENPKSIGFFLDGGYAEYLLVPHERYLVRIGDLPFSEAAPLACSGLTAFHAVELAKAGMDENLVMVGMGGVGLTAVQLARALTKAKIVAVDINEGSLEKAKECGAHLTVNLQREKIQDVLKKNTENPSADAVIDFVNSSKTIVSDLAAVRKGGKVILVGLFGGHLALSLPLVPLRGMQILGCLTGNYVQLAQVVSLAEQGVLKPVVSKKFSLDEASEALTLLRQGKIQGRAVLCPD